MAKTKKETPSDLLYKEGKILYDSQKYDELINLLTDDVLYKYKKPALFNWVGMAWLAKKQYNNALSYYNKAINDCVIKNKYSFYNRGIVWGLLGEDDSAIKDYSIAISLDPKFASAYVNRGNKYSKARKFKLALSDYDNAIKHEPKLSKAYNNRGWLYERLGKYELAFEDYESALKAEPEYTGAERKLDLLLNKLGSSLQLFTEILSSAEVDILTKGNLYRIFSNTKRKSIDKIRALAGKNITNLIGEQIVHYTKLPVANTIATGQSNKLRYYNAIYMNDPEEGQVILDRLHKDVRDAFENANNQEEGNIYIGSFLPAKRHEDELVMWRTYGKDENQVEGAGCSITINKDFFDEYADDNYINPKFVSKDPSTSNIRQNLFRVLYYNKNHEQNGNKMFDCSETKKIQLYIDTLNKQLLELIKLKDNTEKYTDKDKAIDKIIYHLISEIRFFFKSSDYSFENEVRVLQYADKSSDLLRIDERNTLPKKVYIESNKEIQPFIEKITLGPKVPNPKQWLYMDIAMRQNNPDRKTPVEFIISERKYQ